MKDFSSLKDFASNMFTKKSEYFLMLKGFCNKHRCRVGFLVFLFSFIISFSYVHFFSAPKSFPTGSLISIDDGASLRAISADFLQKKIIRSRVLFETLVMFFGDEDRIAAGDYLFEKKLSVFGVAKRISDNDQYLEPVKVTIPEGFNVSEISEAFASKLSRFNKERFLAKAKEKEGYLFPDTYFFLTSAKEGAVLDYMLDNFKKKTESLIDDIELSGRSEQEIITMASIIEGESKGSVDREIISGILWKRLKIKMPLQVDVAPITYKEKGLPEGPISNPGIKSIEAAIYPKSSPYLYYLHDKDGNVHYSSTYKGHLANINAYLR